MHIHREDGSSEVVEVDPSLNGTNPTLSLADLKQVGGDYYKKMGLQPWAVLEDWLTQDQFEGYLLGSAIAYLARYNKGTGDRSGITDVGKAEHYLQKLQEIHGKRGKNPSGAV